MSKWINKKTVPEWVKQRRLETGKYQRRTNQALAARQEELEDTDIGIQNLHSGYTQDKRHSFAADGSKEKNIAIEKGKNPEPCRHYRHCGGCQLQNMTYARQLAFKQRTATALLGRFGRVDPIIGMEHPYHYRNKVQAAFSINQHGRIVSGIYQSSTHRIVPVDSCMIEDEKADEIIVTIRKMMREFKMTAYDERTGRGFLRHVLIKRGFSTGHIMVVLVATSPVFSGKRYFVKALLNKHPEITTIVLNINDKFTSMVLGEREFVLYGPGYIEDVLCGCTFRISAKSFYQINPVQTEILYQTAIAFAGLSGKEIVIDLSKMKEEKVNLVDNDETVILPIINKEKSTNKDTTPKVDKKIKLEGMDDNVTINGKKFDPNRIDFTQKVNRKETWEIENVKDKMGGMKHPFHIHGTQFKVLSVDGKKPSEDMRGKKDVISLEPGQKAKIEVVFKNTGTYMFHCHILEHEDNGMMGQIKVTK